MPRPRKYPHSQQSGTERIPDRFRGHVRHFLSTLDQLDTDFEVHCAVYKSGELQPFTLVYTKKKGETRETPTSSGNVTLNRFLGYVKELQGLLPQTGLTLNVVFGDAKEVGEPVLPTPLPKRRFRVRSRTRTPGHQHPPVP